MEEKSVMETGWYWRCIEHAIKEWVGPLPTFKRVLAELDMDHPGVAQEDFGPGKFVEINYVE